MAISKSIYKGVNTRLKNTERLRIGLVPWIDNNKERSNSPVLQIPDSGIDNDFDIENALSLHDKTVLILTSRKPLIFKTNFSQFFILDIITL